eukprot:PhF_6_TR6449/c0_g1_i1/m.9665
MVSKTQKQKQKKKLRDSEGLGPHQPEVAKPLSEKATRKNVRHKQKIRMGHQNPYDIYEEMERKQGGTLNTCPVCGQSSRVQGFCVKCATAQSSGAAAGSHEVEVAPPVVPKIAVKKTVRGTK